MTFSSWANRLTLLKTNRVGRSAEAYQTRSALRSIWPASGNLLTPEQGQDFQHHARCLREGVDSGFAGLRQSEVQAETDPATRMLLLRLPGSFLLR